MDCGARSARVGIVGGGLAGLAAAAAQVQHGARVDLFEARRQLGGRAGSFRDPQSGELLDHCQHVSMACCTNLADLCRRVGIDGLFAEHARLHFFGPDGRRCDLQASRVCPAPLHLLPALWKLRFLSLGERLSIARAMMRLSRTRADDPQCDLTAQEWLRRQRQSQRAIEQFWSVVLVSALGETLAHASLAAARKVFVDGFLASRRAYRVQVPGVPLGVLYGEHVGGWLRQQGVRVRLETPVARLNWEDRRVGGVELDDGSQLPFDFVIVALPWRRVRDVICDPGGRTPIAPLDAVDGIQSAPITALHLWFDRPFTRLPHAVLVGRLSQWVFNRGTQRDHGSGQDRTWYYQVVISGSRDLAGRARSEILDEVVGDLRSAFPDSAAARLERWRMVTEHDAVFSVRPGLERLRPSQKTSVANLMLAGDWTRTGWPSTMEGAVRSGYLAAEAVLERCGKPARLLVPDLPRPWLARLLLGQ